MPWRRPKKREERGGLVRRSEEERIAEVFEDEEGAEAVALARLDGASLDEVARAEPTGAAPPSPLAHALAAKLEGVHLPDETTPLPRIRAPRARARSADAPAAPTAKRASAAPSFPIRELAVGDVDLEVGIGSLRLRNPVMPASGCFGWGLDYAEIFEPALLGALVTKGTTSKPRPGNPQYRIAETPSGILNSIGLENR